MDHHHTRKDVESFFEVDRMATRDAVIFEMDLDDALAEFKKANGAAFDDAQYRQIILTLSDKGWYQRRSDTLTRSGVTDKADDGTEGKGRLLDAGAAAHYLGLTASQFKKIAARGHFSFVSLTGEVRNNGRWQHKKYRPADLDAWAAKNVVEGKIT